MKLSIKLTLTAVCLLMILALPFLLSSPAMLSDVNLQLLEEREGSEDSIFGLLTWLLPSACAEEATAEKTLSATPLPIDFSAGMMPNPANFTADGYEDESIRVRAETVEENGVTYRVVWVEIADASQMRTATAGKLTSSAVALTSSMAKKNNAIVALNGDYFSNDPAKTSFEYRMGEKIRSKSNSKKDILIIDENGDFHLFIKSDAEKMQGFADSGHQIINAFTFGPALVIDGEECDIDDEYGYNPNNDEPRMGIGQMGPLSYVIVLAEGRLKNSDGVTQQELAHYMFSLGCTQAYNLDGGNSATLVFNGEYYQKKTQKNERALSDIIYFASAVDPATWQ